MTVLLCANTILICNRNSIKDVIVGIYKKKHSIYSAKSPSLNEFRYLISLNKSYLQ